MQDSINERVKFLVDYFNLSARKFSREIGVPENNTQNYLPPRVAEPGAHYLKCVLLRFESVNPDWLLTGRGEAFLSETPSNLNNSVAQNRKISRSQVIGNVGRDATHNHGASGNEQALKREIELLKDQLVEKERLIQILLPK